MANTNLQINRKFHVIYRVVNLINGKFYVGAHSTDELYDSYMGSGDNILRAIKKYGVENFKKEILHVFDNPKDMFLEEAKIVTTEFIQREDVYNIIPGGYGGFNKGSKNLRHLHNPKTGKRCAVHHSCVQKMIQEGWTLGRGMSSTSGRVWVNRNNEKRMIPIDQIEKFLDEGWIKGLPKSPTSGKKWIFNPAMKKYSLCDPSELKQKIEDGWIKQKWAPKKSKII